MAAGTPIEGEAGVGYTLRRDYELPPLMFDGEEIQALVLGARLVSAFGDASLVGPARSAMAKIEAVLPSRSKLEAGHPALYAPRTSAAEAQAHSLDTVRDALLARRKLRLRYRREDGEESLRNVRPLGAFFWGRSWTLTAWCELRRDFRNFRLDRILELRALDATFHDEAGRTLRDYLRKLGKDAEGILDD